MLFVGSLALGWVLNEHKKVKKLQEETRQSLQLSLTEMSKFVPGKANTGILENFVHDEQQKNKSRYFQNHQELLELTYAFSIVCLIMSGAIFLWWLLVGISRLIIKIYLLIKIGLNRLLGKEQKKAPPKPELEKEKQIQYQKKPPPRIDMEWLDPANNFEMDRWMEPHTSSEEQSCAKIIANKTFGKIKQKDDTEKQKENTEKILQDFCASQTQSLEKHVTEFREIAESVQEATREHSEPVNQAINELFQQVSAIRDYASQQHQRVEKLQEGYDWNIIRNFCLKTIRCIDNLENRIDRLNKQGVDSKGFEEIRDELIFALESSGIEPFLLEINTDYKGQEKLAEAVKEKTLCEDPCLNGKIAEVVRCGYKYFLDEQNYKVVRAAQVKLYVQQKIGEQKCLI